MSPFPGQLLLWGYVVRVTCLFCCSAEPYSTADYWDRLSAVLADESFRRHSAGSAHHRPARALWKYIHKSEDVSTLQPLNKCSSIFQRWRWETELRIVFAYHF